MIIIIYFAKAIRTCIKKNKEKISHYTNKYCSSNDSKRFSLKSSLNHVKGSSSFDESPSNGFDNTHKKTAIAMGSVEHNFQIYKILYEACNNTSSIKNIYCIISFIKK